MLCVAFPRSATSTFNRPRPWEVTGIEATWGAVPGHGDRHRWLMVIHESRQSRSLTMTHDYTEFLFMTHDIS